MDDTDGICQAVESGELYGCHDCHEVSETRFCASCDEGRCDICGELVKKGEAFFRDPAFPRSCFCEGCSGIVSQPSVAELAERLAKGAA